jgi:hypothetical protein
LTARPSARAANITPMYSGYMKIFMPKPPPTSAEVTRMLLSGTLKIMSAMILRSMNVLWHGT